MRLVILFCSTNRSAVLLSKCSAHKCVSVAASISWTLTRTWSRPTDTAFQYIADAKLAPDLLAVYRLAPIGERCVARDDEHVREPRQIGRQILGDAVGEVLLLRVVAEVGEWQHNDRQARRHDTPRY